MMPKLFLGPMTLNTVQAVIDCDLPIALIPSRRQVEYDGGYTGLDTKTLYQLTRGSKVLLCRDHAGPGQGAFLDDGLESLKEDAKYMDLIHIDPWKETESLIEAIEATANLIKYCLKLNSKLKFEVGTEQAIKEYSPKELDFFLKSLRTLLGDAYTAVEYAVVQSGTGLDLPGRKNTRTFQAAKLEEFLSVCRTNNVKSKEHNGDYLVDNFGIATRFSLGLDAINIAPELGQLETEYYLYQIGSNKELFQRFHSICVSSGKWTKWVDREVSSHELILTAGHYVVNTPDFKENIKKHFPQADQEIQHNLKQLINKMYLQAYGH